MKINRKIIVVALHLLVWAVIAILPRYLMHDSGFRIRIYQDLSTWAPVAIIFYLNYFIFIPRFFTRRRFITYYATVILTILIFFFSIKIIDNIYFKNRPLPPPFIVKNYGGRMWLNDSLYLVRDSVLKDFKLRIGGPPDEKRIKTIRLMRREIDNLALYILAIAVGTSIRMTQKWQSNEKERNEMENQKLSAELSFLKSQINPHFFFNTLNSIYSLAIQKSDKTPEAIVKLSEIMRYIIYESDRNVVPLKNELEYIRNYVELQRLRLMSNVTISYEVTGFYHDIMIEPLLFLPFIENAFKHGIDYTKKCEIKIKFVITPEQLIFTVENPVVKQRKTEPAESSGIGLANSKKRLQLLYQNNHELKVTQTEESFSVQLIIKINRNELYHS